MKIFLSILCVLTFSKECNSNKKDALIAQDESVIIYQAVSRGFFEEIKLENKKLTYCNDRNRKIYTTHTFSEEDWETCLGLLSEININSLPKLVAPTSRRETDGAAHATLTVLTGATETQSSTFDHGYPPSSIKALVEKLLSIKKMSIKQ